MEGPPPEEKELVYSEAEDGKAKPIPVAEFAKYFRNKSSHGAVVLREEFKVRLFFTITAEIHSYFDNVMTKFMINNRTDA